MAIPKNFDPHKPLSNTRHEVFALEVAKGSAKSRAYILAGYKSDGHAAEAGAYGLMRNATVARRVRALQELAAERAVLTKAGLIDMLMAIVEEARTERQFTAAVRGVEVLGREVNTFVEKREQGKPGEFSHLTTAELRATIASRVARLGFSTEGTRDAGTSPPPGSKPN